MHINASNLNEGPLSFDQFNAFFSLREKKTQNSCPKIGVKVIKSQSSLFNRDWNENNNNETKQKKTYAKIMHSVKGK